MIAVQRFEYQEQETEIEWGLRGGLLSFMDEYEALGHMTAAKNPGQYIIPHHAVWKQEIGKIKWLVVFDASTRSASGKSLKDTLCVGSKLQRDIVDVLLGFRLYHFAFSTDICKVYRQIKVNADYRSYKHVL